MSIIEGTEVVQDSASPLDPWLEERRLDGQLRVRQGIGRNDVSMEGLNRVHSGCRLLAWSEKLTEALPTYPV